MKTFPLLYFLFVILFLFAGCKKNNPSTCYKSIEGTWRCTPETILPLPNGYLEAVIKINGVKQNKPDLEGCFMWNGKYYNEWPIVEASYNDSIKELKLTDEDGSIFIGNVNSTYTRIEGMVYSEQAGELVPEDKLGLMRAGDSLTNKLFIPRAPNQGGNITDAYKKPKKDDDGLQTASILNYTDSLELASLMERIIGQEWGRLEALLIMKDNQLVLEEYFYGFHRNQLHNIHSCTKSIVSLLLGIALEGHPEYNINQYMFDFFPEFDSLKTPENENITLKHLLTMTAGFAPESDIEDNMPDSLYSFILSSPVARKPGSKFEYSNESTELLGGVIKFIEGIYVDELAKEKLFAPLGISNYLWQTKNGKPLCYANLELLPRDMAKIGLLALNNGKWEGKQIVPKQWVIESTKAHISESDYFEYGYQWWCRSDSTGQWWNEPGDKSKEYGFFTALGYGGQFIMVIRDLNLVVVTTSSDYNGSTGKWISKIPLVIEEIVPLFE